MEKIVGATLVALGVYVVVSLVRNGRNFRMRSRWMFIFAGVRRLRAWARSADPSESTEAVCSRAHDHEPPRSP